MVRVHFGPPLLKRVRQESRPGRSSSKGQRAKMDSKGGSWKQSCGLFQPAWLFRRKASPFWPTTSFKCKMQNAKLRDWLKQFKQLSCFIESLEKEAQRCTLKTEHCNLLMQLWEGNSKGKLLIKRVIDTILAKNFFLSLHNSTRETRNGLFY